MVDGFVETTLNTNKTQMVASNYGTFWLLVVCENFNPKTDPLLGAAFIRKIAGSKKSVESSTCFFFKIGVRGPKQKLGRGADPPRQFCQFHSHRKSTPLASIACH
jgi:hypothetical protein